MRGTTVNDNDPFLRWFVRWKGTRPDDRPIGWYDIDDLQAAFNAGITHEREQVIVAALGPERAEALLRAIREKD